MTFNLMPVLSGVVALLPWFRPEVEPAPPRRDVNPTGHFGAVIAANGSGQMLVAYKDGRGNDSITSTGDNLRFTRVTPEGNMLDPGGIQMVASGPSRDYPALATDGTDYLVAWAEHTTYEESHLRVARIGADGTVLQAPAVVS